MQRDSGQYRDQHQFVLRCYAYRNRPIHVVAEGFGGDLRSAFRQRRFIPDFNLIAQLRI